MEPKFKIGDQVLVSTVNFHNFSTNQKLKDLFIGPFPFLELIGKNALRQELHAAFPRRHPVFPVSLIKMYKESDDTVFPKRVLRSKKLPPLDEETAVVHKILNKRIFKMVLRKNFNSWFLSKISHLIVKDGCQPKKYLTQVPFLETLELKLEKKNDIIIFFFFGGGSVSLWIK